MTIRKAKIAAKKVKDAERKAKRVSLDIIHFFLYYNHGFILERKEGSSARTSEGGVTLRYLYLNFIFIF